MACYESMSAEQQRELLGKLQKQYRDFQARGLKLDMSRGKPGADQLDLSVDMLSISEFRTESGTDCRNYGMPDGLPEVKQLFADLLEVAPENIIVGGNSSLNMMFDKISSAMTHGINGGMPWMRQEKVKFLCPSPGYDRHFGVCEFFGIEMIPVEMTAHGPDMDTVERLVSADPSIKGIWCVPKYSNPQGITYSDETVRRFATLKPAAPDFRMYWDNAYCVHELTDEPDHLLNLFAECKRNGTENLPIMFASTSKISFPGGGVSVMVSSEENLKWDRKRISAQTIGPDKLNQLRHLYFFHDAQGIREQMKKHRALLQPKFHVVLDMLEKELLGTGALEWTNPNGGYFISVDTMDGCARRVVSLCKEAGVVLTGAGATYPYGKDPQDRNIRLAPTFPPVEELRQAMELFCLCVKIATLEKLVSA